jgi:predicted ATP-binding protein involved in virulence
MRLRHVTLNNYRCFDELDLELHPRLTVLVGTNGAGKTAVLDGIAAGLSPILRYLSSADERLSGKGAGIKDQDFKLVPRSGRAKKESWSAAPYARVKLSTTSDLSWDYWRPSVRGAEPPAKVGEAKLSAYLSQIVGSLSTPAPQCMPVFAYYGARRGYIVAPGRLHPTKQNYEQPASALAGALESMSDFKEMLKWFDDAEAAELRDNKGHRTEDFELAPALEAVRYALTKLLGGAYQNPHFQSDRRFVVDRANGGPAMQVGQLSQGYQSMLALGMDFARRMALANPHLNFENEEAVRQALSNEWSAFDEVTGPPEVLPDAAPLVAPAIMLVDEIDLHLHPSWQQRVIGDLMQTFPNTQFIVTTHSPQVLTTVPSECIRILSDTKVFAAPAGSEGAEPERMLKQVLGLKDVRPDVHATRLLKQYLALVDADQASSPAARSLRQELDAIYRGNEPALLEADLRIENRRWEMEQ